ncbi:transposase [Candidatus Magnetomoraceae bacterium gMMP-15]
MTLFVVFFPLLKKKKRLNKQLSRKEEKSNNRKKAKLKLAKIEAQIANIRNDYLHQTTTKLILNHSFIGMEDLNIKGMMKNHKLARHLSDQAFGEFKRQIQYKAKEYDTNVEFIDRFFPSSKKCSKCGEIKKNLKLSDRMFNCSYCGFHIDRDVNAAINILTESLKQEQYI